MKRAPALVDADAPYKAILDFASPIPHGPANVPTDQATDDVLEAGWQWTNIVPGGLLQVGPLTAWAAQDQQSRGLSQQVAVLKQEIDALRKSLDQLAAPHRLRIPVATLAPEPYEIIRPFEAIVELSEGEYIGSFFDAGISASGESPMEAFANLKDMVTGVFGLLLDMDGAHLGPEPKRQLDVLREFIRRK